MSQTPPEKQTEKSWQSRIGEATDALAASFVESISYDRRIYKQDVAGSIAHHPLRGLEGGYGFDVPMLSGEFVTTDQGTGLVHIAPLSNLTDLSLNKTRITDAGLAHIRRWSTGNSETIVTESQRSAARFTAEVDAAAVLVNASSRFVDGGELGFGAEIGISTQKLHARGPMGLAEMTSTKYVVTGSGQTRR